MKKASKVADLVVSISQREPVRFEPSGDRQGATVYDGCMSAPIKGSDKKGYLNVSVRVPDDSGIVVNAGQLTYLSGEVYMQAYEGKNGVGVKLCIVAEKAEPFFIDSNNSKPKTSQKFASGSRTVVKNDDAPLADRF